jgi:hypothetical protein
MPSFDEVEAVADGEVAGDRVVLVEQSRRGVEIAALNGAAVAGADRRHDAAAAVESNIARWQDETGTAQ